MRLIVCLALLILLIAGCKDKRKQELIQVVSEWQGKEILFPEQLTFTQYVRDTVEYEIPDSEHKILIFVDSLGCTSCKLQLDKWKTFISEVDALTGGEVPFLFFFQSKDYDDLYYLFKRERFDHPVCIDSRNEMDALNNFSYNPTFQTFLLDRENKVRLLGNPVYSVQMKELYLKYLSGEQETTTDKQAIKTTVKTGPAEIDLGEFPVQSTRTATFELRNTGKNPLVILDVSTTCGCAKARFEKQPIATGTITHLEVEMTPKETGFFDEMLTVKCNTDQIIQLKIKGTAR